MHPGFSSQDPKSSTNQEKTYFLRGMISLTTSPNILDPPDIQNLSRIFTLLDGKQTTWNFILVAPSAHPEFSGVDHPEESEFTY
jgi:hypothetical protein